MSQALSRPTQNLLWNKALSVHLWDTLHLRKPKSLSNLFRIAQLTRESGCGPGLFVLPLTLWDRLPHPQLNGTSNCCDHQKQIISEPNLISIDADARAYELDELFKNDSIVLMNHSDAEKFSFWQDFHEFWNVGQVYLILFSFNHVTKIDCHRLWESRQILSPSSPPLSPATLPPSFLLQSFLPLLVSPAQ